MLSTIGKTVIAGSLGIATLGFSAQQASADSFSVSVHTPNVSAGYSNYRGHDSGYVSVYTPAPRPVVTYYPPPPPPVVYCPPPAPVVVYRPVVVREPVHVCSYDRRPVTRYYINDCGRRVYYTEYVRVRSCDDYHRGKHHHEDRDGHHGHGRGHYEGHGRGQDRDHYARNWDR